MATGLTCVPAFGQNRSVEMKKDHSSSDAGTATKDDAVTTGRYLQQKREHYQKKAEAKLSHIEDKMKRLFVRAEKKGLIARGKISRAADDLRTKSESARNRLKDLIESGEGKWDHAKAELDSILRDLERSYSRMAAKLKD